MMTPKRVPVMYRYDAINPDFLHMMAEIGHYASEKYGSWDQYLAARLEGEKSPINHAYDHLRQYRRGDRYDHFDGDPRRHLVAVAYNVMMAFAYHEMWGPEESPFVRRLQEVRGEEKSAKLLRDGEKKGTLAGTRGVGKKGRRPSRSDAKDRKGRAI
jgi:hypothetical protein